MVAFYCLLAVALITTAMFLIWRDKNRLGLNALLKGIASLSFLALGLVDVFKSGSFTLPALFILLGLSSSVFGDMFLAGKDFKTKEEDGALYSGFGFFAVTQVLYYLALVFMYGFSIWAIAIGVCLTLAVLFSEKLLKLNFGKFRIVVALYSLLLMTVFGQAIMSFAMEGYTLAGLLFMIGTGLFALSDLILSFIYFKADTKDYFVTLNLVAYYLAQIVIASAVLFLK